MTGMGVEAGAQAARSRALAVLRIRSRALAVALLPAAVAVVLLAGGSTGHLVGPGWGAARWTMSVTAVIVLLAAGAIALVVARARPAVSPTVAIAEESAPDLYRMVRDLADRLDVPVPSAIALTPDCDSWLEDRTHRAHGPPPREDHDEIAGVRGNHRRVAAAPVLVIGSPFLWWMRVGELRAVLAPVVAGTGPSAHPDIAAARRFVRGLDAAVAVTSAPGRSAFVRPVLAGVGWVARLLLRSCRGHAGEMERGVAAAAAERAQAVDYGLRIVAQEQVGLAYAGWDRLLTRVALPAWRMGRWPSRLDAGVVAALTELSRRDRLAEGFTSRLGERPACDLLEEPGTVDEAASLLAARLFHGGPAEPGRDWAPVDWQEYPDEVVDLKWRTDAARLHRVLDALGVRRTPDPSSPDPDGGPTLARVMDHLTEPTATRPTPEAERHVDDPTDVAPSQATGGGGETAGTPGTSGTPGTADTPDTSGTPGSPSTAEAPGTAGTLGTSGTPGTPGSPSTADAPGTADTPDTSGTPGSPSTADAPDTADTLGTSGTPATPRATADALPGEPGKSVEAPPAEGTRRTVPHPHEPTRPTGPTGETGETRPARMTELTEPTARNANATPTPGTDPGTDPGTAPGTDSDPDDDLPSTERSAALAARLSAEIAREEASASAKTSAAGGPPTPGQSSAGSPDTAFWDDGSLPLFPLQPPRTARELLTDHVTAMVCCAAMDTAGATPGLDWLDGPSLMVNGERAADLAPRVLSLVEDGDPAPLQAWLVKSGIRPEKPVRLV
ncbi:hypothetical protein ACFWWT_12275 [Streptomyces sp. NPDC058676]|uniref:hypothetical protein n=1 Tax=unclassified Streptomyces TaxID=2593676 RepID=UPI00365876D2